MSELYFSYLICTYLLIPSSFLSSLSSVFLSFSSLPSSLTTFQVLYYITYNIHKKKKKIGFSLPSLYFFCFVSFKHLYISSLIDDAQQNCMSVIVCVTKIVCLLLSVLHFSSNQTCLNRLCTGYTLLREKKKSACILVKKKKSK